MNEGRQEGRREKVVEGSLFNLPLLKALEGKKSILIAGAGGGFDVFSGIPLYFALKVIIFHD